MPVSSILWRNILMAGHEACQLSFQSSQWHLDGTAVFLHEMNPCRLGYQITCDEAWHTLSANVDGWVGSTAIRVYVKTDTQNTWWLNDLEIPLVAGCIDIDLNFSPSTNTIAIRRLKLAVGAKEDTTAAWLRFPSFTLEPLPQSYQRVGDYQYRYESGGGSFVADLQVNSAGLVTDYQGIWAAETGAGV